MPPGARLQKRPNQKRSREKMRSGLKIKGKDGANLLTKALARFIVKG